MATVTAKNLIGPAAALTSSVTTYASNGSGTTFGIIRTILATSANGSTLTIALGADAAGTRIINGISLGTNVNYVLNGWIITPTNSAHAIDATSNATGTNCIANVSGYEST
jgi:hypothetical protein